MKTKPVLPEMWLAARIAAIGLEECAKRRVRVPNIAIRRIARTLREFGRLEETATVELLGIVFAFGRRRTAGDRDYLRCRIHNLLGECRSLVAEIEFTEQQKAEQPTIIGGTAAVPGFAKKVMP
ncbi:MAG: hypothetical protein ACRD1Z_08755 [Vicinamibacteria bacterium]